MIVSHGYKYGKLNMISFDKYDLYHAWLESKHNYKWVIFNTWLSKFHITRSFHPVFINDFINIRCFINDWMVLMMFSWKLFHKNGYCLFLLDQNLPILVLKHDHLNTFIYISHNETSQVVEIHRNDMNILRAHHGWWWPSDARTMGTCRHGIIMFVPA